MKAGRSISDLTSYKQVRSEEEKRSEEERERESDTTRDKEGRERTGEETRCWSGCPFRPTRHSIVMDVILEDRLTTKSEGAVIMSRAKHKRNTA